MDAEDTALVAGLRRLVQRLNDMPDDAPASLTPLGVRITAHLGVDPTLLPLTVEQLAPHQLVDADSALSTLAAADPDAVVIGIGGGQERHHEDFASMLSHRGVGFTAEGPVGYETAATGPRSSRQIVSLGIRLFTFADLPVAVLQRAANPMFGRARATLEVLVADADVARRLVAEVRRLMVATSVVRGNVVTFAQDEYGEGVGRMTFLDRPSVAASAVVLPEGLLQRVRDQVIGISAHAERLRAQGQHLKRGVLLYGPPGTGKTLTVRHLLHESPEATVVLLQGEALGLVGEAARLARALAPSIVVLEDVDLVAAQRGMFGIQPLLFEVLDALDGLSGDADVAFVLTTNRADILEPALAARPGRIDLALEVPLPDAQARRSLFRLYAAELPLSGEALDAAADAADGVTASFAKELIRRAVLTATLAGREVTDADLAAALEDLQSAAEGIGRALFGGEGTSPGIPGEEGMSFGWFQGDDAAAFGMEPHDLDGPNEP